MQGWTQVDFFDQSWTPTVRTRPEPDKIIESPISAQNNVIKTQCSLLVTSLLYHYCIHKRTQGGTVPCPLSTL